VHEWRAFSHNNKEKQVNTLKSRSVLKVALTAVIALTTLLGATSSYADPPTHDNSVEHVDYSDTWLCDYGLVDYTVEGVTNTHFTTSPDGDMELFQHASLRQTFTNPLTGRSITSMTSQSSSFVIDRETNMAEGVASGLFGRVTIPGEGAVHLIAGHLTYTIDLNTGAFNQTFRGHLEVDDSDPDGLNRICAYIQ